MQVPGNLIGAAFLAVFPYFISLEVKHFRDIENSATQDSPGENSSDTFDFIIVGAGTAGCILANRLSLHHNVLLLEAGGPQPPILDIPAFRLFAINHPDINYMYTSVPQRNAMNRSFLKPAGKMMGGSYAHNTLIFNRGHSRDYEEWARLTNDSSWTYDNLLEHFKMIESYFGPFEGPERGASGDIPVHTTRPPILDTYIGAAAEAGFGYFDPNGRQREGLAAQDSSQSPSGRAVTTCTLLVDPLIGTRPSLTLIKYAEVTEVILESQIAKGVKYNRHSKEFVALASKEVIVSSGALGSPMLLFKSGIGPGEMLREAVIDVVADLPVGKNLQDHPGLISNFSITDSSLLRNVANNLTGSKIEEYLESGGDGIMSEVGYGPQGFFVTQNAKDRGEGDWPDVQFEHRGDILGNSGNTFSMIVILNPLSHGGEIKLNTSLWLSGERDVVKLALIDYAQLVDPRDIDSFLQGIRIIENIRNTPTFQRLNITLNPIPECAQEHEVNSDEYWRCAIAFQASTQFHTVGTCRMGYGSQDPNSVVDTDFRVLGIERLRVIDASVFPRITNANPNAPTMLLAERGAEKILQTYDGRRQRSSEKL